MNATSTDLSASRRRAGAGAERMRRLHDFDRVPSMVLMACRSAQRAEVHWRGNDRGIVPGPTPAGIGPEAPQWHFEFPHDVSAA